jgi:hypothetical protein
MGGLKEAEDFKSKRRAVRPKFGPTIETALNVLDFPAGTENNFSVFFQKL